MDVAGKTPVAFLQELCVRTHWIPEYDLVHNGVGTDKPTFIYELVCDSYKSQGCGGSKKDAKHTAAYNMLQLLQSDPQFADRDIARFLKLMETSSQCPIVVEMPTTKVNAVGLLDDFCITYNLESPMYDFVREEGPPHHKSFTIRCVVSDLRREAVACTKKQAKQLVCSAMYATLTDIAEYDTVCRTDRVNRERNAGQFIDFSDEYPPRKPILSLPVKQSIGFLTCVTLFSNTLTDCMPHVKKDHFLKNTDKPLTEIFQTVLSELRINYRIKHVGMIGGKYVVVATVETVPEISCLGKGAELDESVNNAIRELIRMMCMSNSLYSC